MLVSTAMGALPMDRDSAEVAGGAGADSVGGADLAGAGACSGAADPSEVDSAVAASPETGSVAW